MSAHENYILFSPAAFVANMAFLEYLNYTKDYVSDICNGFCDAIVSNTLVSRFYTPAEGRDEQEIAFIQIRSFGRHNRSSRANNSKRFSSSSAERPKDDVRKANEMLCVECTQAAEEYKRLRGVVEQLGREYEASKDVDFFRRYGMLKGMIKRSILHLKINNTDDQNQVTNTYGKQKEEMRKREEHLTGLDTEEILEENEELQEKIKEYRRKSCMFKELIDQMERSYDDCKRYIVIQRYRLMKTMIKTVIHNKWIQPA